MILLIHLVVTIAVIVVYFSFSKKKYENKGKVLKTAYTYLSLIGFIASLT